ncbi:MAG: twin-arginine translocase TatA/TatE family subunit, partial [Alphaproteobacteria bacterium]
MFGFSLAELAIVLLVILFFIKPKDLPEIARYIGKAIY